MANIRLLHPSLFDNERIAILEPIERYLFIGMWCYADKEGRLEDIPVRFKKTILGYDNVSIQSVDKFLNNIADSGFIIRYTANDKRYIQIVNFTKYQVPLAGEKESVIPCPDGYIPPVSNVNICINDSSASKKSRKKTEIPDPPHDEGEVPFVKLMLKDGTFFPAYNSYVNELLDAFPTKDVCGELKKMERWLTDNIQKRKTRVGIKRFVYLWLNRANDCKNKNKTSTYESTFASLTKYAANRNN